MDADGTDAVALTQQVTLTEPKAFGHLSVDLTPDWSPDGSYVVFVRGDLSTGFYSSLQVVAATGGAPTKIVDLFAENPYLVFPNLCWPAWSPNGDFIAFSREYQRPDRTMTNLLRVLPMSGPSPTGPMVNLLEGARYPGWKNDGTVLTFAKGDFSTSLWNAPFSAGPPPALGAGTQLTTSTFDCRPRWSPDDTQIVYSSNGTTQNVRDIYVVSAAGGTPTNLTSSAKVDDAFPDWSPVLP
jgi:Tol biopolymer transport system component